MKKFLLCSMLAIMAGCANTNAPVSLQLEQSYGQICASYVAVMRLATAAQKAGKLTEAEISAISTADAQAFPICTGPTPTDLNDAVTKVTAAVTTIALNAALDAEKAK